MRYMDDFRLIHHSKKVLRNCWRVIAQKLKDIGLCLNDKTCIHPLRHGVKFLQWRFILSGTGKVTMKMLQDKVYSEKRRLRKLLMREAVGELPKGTAYCSFVSWIANAERGNTYYQMQSVTNYFERIKGEIYDNG